MSFQCQLASIFPPKIHQHGIKNRSWKASIFWSILTSILRRLRRAPRRPKTPQDGDPSAKTAPRGPQDGPKMAPRGPQSWRANRLFSILTTKGPQGPPETPPRLIFGSFLVDFRWFWRWFLIDFSSRTPSYLDLVFISIFDPILFHFGFDHWAFSTPSLPFASLVFLCLGLSWLDFPSQLGPNLAPKIHQNPLKIDAKMPSQVDLIFWSIFDRFLLPNSTPRISNFVSPQLWEHESSKIAFRS